MDSSKKQNSFASAFYGQYNSDQSKVNTSKTLNNQFQVKNNVAQQQEGKNPQDFFQQQYSTQPVQSIQSQNIQEKDDFIKKLLDDSKQLQQVGSNLNQRQQYSGGSQFQQQDLSQLLSEVNVLLQKAQSPQSQREQQIFQNVQQSQIQSIYNQQGFLVNSQNRIQSTVVAQKKVKNKKSILDFEQINEKQNEEEDQEDQQYEKEDDDQEYDFGRKNGQKQMKGVQKKKRNNLEFSDSSDSNEEGQKNMEVSGRNFSQGKHQQNKSVIKKNQSSVSLRNNSMSRQNLQQKNDQNSNQKEKLTNQNQYNSQRNQNSLAKANQINFSVSQSMIFQKVNQSGQNPTNRLAKATLTQQGSQNDISTNSNFVMRQKSQNQLQQQQQNQPQNLIKFDEVSQNQSYVSSNRIIPQNILQNINNNNSGQQIQQNYQNDVIFCVVCEEYINISLVEKHGQICQHKKERKKKNMDQLNLGISKVKSLVQKKQNYFLKNQHLDSIFVKLEEYSALVQEYCQQAMDTENQTELLGITSSLKIISKRLQEIDHIQCIWLLEFAEKTNKFLNYKIELNNSNNNNFEINKSDFANLDEIPGSQQSKQKIFWEIDNLSEIQPNSSPLKYNLEEGNENNNQTPKQIKKNYQTGKNENIINQNFNENQNSNTQTNNIFNINQNNLNQQPQLTEIKYQDLSSGDKKKNNQKQNQNKKNNYVKIFDKEQNSQNQEIQQTNQYTSNQQNSSIQKQQTPNSGLYKIFSNYQNSNRVSNQFNKNQQENNLQIKEESRKQFFEIAAEMKKQYSQEHPVHTILLAELYHTCQKANIPKNEWKEYIDYTYSNYVQNQKNSNQNDQD